MLRDHGPKSRDFLCAMLTLRTWMGDDGFAGPGLRTWAAGTRMAVGTLRKHVDFAIRNGWLGLNKNQGERQSWRKAAYRAGIPNSLEHLLTDKDESLSNTLISQIGDISDVLCSPLVDTPSKVNGHDAVSPKKIDTPSSAVISNANKPSPVSAKVCQSTSDAVSKNAGAVSKQPPCCVTAVSVESRKRLKSNKTAPEASEVLEALEPLLKTEGAIASDRTTFFGNVNSKKVEEGRKSRDDRIRKAITALPSYGDAEIANVARVTLPEVERVRQADSLSRH